MPAVERPTQDDRRRDAILRNERVFVTVRTSIVPAITTIAEQEEPLPIVRLETRRDGQPPVVQQRPDPLPAVLPPRKHQTRNRTPAHQLDGTQRRRNHTLPHRGDQHAVPVNHPHRPVRAHVVIPRQRAPRHHHGRIRSVLIDPHHHELPPARPPPRPHRRAHPERPRPLRIPLPVRPAPQLHPPTAPFQLAHHGQQPRIAPPHHLLHPHPLPRHHKLPMLQPIPLVHKHPPRIPEITSRSMRLPPPPQLPFPSPHMPHHRRLPLPPHPLRHPQHLHLLHLRIAQVIPHAQRPPVRLPRHHRHRPRRLLPDRMQRQPLHVPHP